MESKSHRGPMSSITVDESSASKMTPEQRLKRFLQYGREISFCDVGIDAKEEIQKTNKLLPLIDLFIESQKFNEPVAIIVKAFSDGYSTSPEMLVYALAVCAKQKSSVQLTTAAYKAFKTVCASPENFFLFIKYAAKLAPVHSIWGSGFKSVIRDWYLKKDPKTLAEIVTKYKKRHGWKHKDIMKLVHLKAEDPVMAAIIKYVLYDIATAKKEYGETPGAMEILNYIQSIEDFRRMTDEQQAARTLESLHLTLDYVPVHFMKNKEIWSGLVGNLPLGELIKNLERIGQLGFLEPNSPVLPRVLDALRDERSIAESHLHPAQVFVATKKYKTSYKYAAGKHAHKKRKTVNGSSEIGKPNPQVLSALDELFYSTCKFLAPTGLRYRVDIRIEKPKKNLYRRPFISYHEATMVTCLCLICACEKVDIVPCNDETSKPVPLTCAMLTQAVKDMFQEKGLFYNEVPLQKYLQMNEHDSKEYDVFILFIEKTTEETVALVTSAFNSYKNRMKLPNAKLIIIHLRAPTIASWTGTYHDSNILEIAGFHEKVPRIIEAFSRGVF